MAETTKTLNAILYLNDISQYTSDIKFEYYSLERFYYNLVSSRNGRGEPTCSTESATLNFTIKSPSTTTSKKFIEYITENDSFNFSILYEARINIDKDAANTCVYKDCRSSFMVDGYVSSIEEDFLLATTNALYLNVSIVMRSMTFIGSNSNKIIDFV